MYNEIWLPIREVDNRYSISNLGRVMNNETGKILKPWINNNGYHSITAYFKQHIRKVLLIHRYVALYFCDGYNEGLVVNHIDGNKLNNMASNLEWVSQAENMRHAYKTGLAKPHPEVCEKLVLCIETGIQYKSIMEASRITGIHRGNISAVCRGNRKTAGGYTWKYVNETDITRGRRSVMCIETGEVFSSILSASKTKGICATSIHKVCNSIYKTAGGYTWKYIEGEKY